MKYLITLFFIARLFAFPAQTIPPIPNCVATVSDAITIFTNQDNAWNAVLWQTDKPCRLDFRLNINSNLAQIKGYTFNAPEVTCTQNAWSIACFGEITETATLDVDLQGLTTLGNTDAWLEDHTATWQRVWITALQKTFLPFIQGVL